MEEESKSSDLPFRLLLFGGAIVGGWVLSRLGQWRMLRHEVTELRRAMQEHSRRLVNLEEALAAAQLAPVTATAPKHAVETELATLKSPAADEEVAPEIVAVIAAAVTAFLGKKVRIHQARLVNPEVVSPWAQQGRVYVQASHNLGRR